MSAVHNLQQVCSSQLAANLQFKLPSSLLTPCSRLVIIKPEQAMRTHPDIGLMIGSCNKPAADLLQLARFWLCIFSGSKFKLISNASQQSNSMVIIIYFSTRQFFLQCFICVQGYICKNRCQNYRSFITLGVFNTIQQNSQ
jgi:hypothetical protein